MTRETLLGLADRCEQATGPDRELDALIWCTLNGKKYADHNEAYSAYHSGNPETQVEFTEPPKRTRLVTGSQTTGGHAKPVTASLDSAMTLVPEGHVLAALSQEDHRDSNRAWFAEYRRGFKTSYDKAFPSWAATPALALCAAALKSRASL
jgi:hypothetical protein